RGRGTVRLARRRAGRRTRRRGSEPRSRGDGDGGRPRRQAAGRRRRPRCRQPDRARRARARTRPRRAHPAANRVLEPARANPERLDRPDHRRHGAPGVTDPVASLQEVPAPRSNVVLLGWVAFWSGMSQEMIYPLLPTFVVLALSSSRAVLGVIEGALVVGVTLARLVTARLLD